MTQPAILPSIFSLAPLSHKHHSGRTLSQLASFILFLLYIATLLTYHRLTDAYHRAALQKSFSVATGVQKHEDFRPPAYPPCCRHRCK